MMLKIPFVKWTESCCVVDEFVLALHDQGHVGCEDEEVLTPIYAATSVGREDTFHEIVTAYGHIGLEDQGHAQGHGTDEDQIVIQSAVAAEKDQNVKEAEREVAVVTGVEEKKAGQPVRPDAKVERETMSQSRVPVEEAVKGGQGETPLLAGDKLIVIPTEQNLQTTRSPLCESSWKG